jgi:hypothetical protein
MLGNGEAQHPAMRNNPRGWKKEAKNEEKEKVVTKIRTSTRYY